MVCLFLQRSEQNWKSMQKTMGQYWCRFCGSFRHFWDQQSANVTYLNIHTVLTPETKGCPNVRPSHKWRTPYFFMIPLWILFCHSKCLQAMIIWELAFSSNTNAHTWAAVFWEQFNWDRSLLTSLVLVWSSPHWKQPLNTRCEETETSPRTQEMFVVSRANFFNNNTL